MKKPMIAIVMQIKPPAQNQTRIPSQSENGPAINSPIGEIAVAPLASKDMTRPCISGRMID